MAGQRPGRTKGMTGLPAIVRLIMENTKYAISYVYLWLKQMNCIQFWNISL